MMKLAVIAANGKTGQRVVEAALDKGLDVTAIVRHDNQSKATQVIPKGIFNLTADDLAPFDVIVDAFGVYDPERLEEQQTTLEHLTRILKGADTRLYIVGGAGSLYVDDEMTLQLKDTPDFPDAYKPLAESMSKGLAVLRQAESVHWIMSVLQLSMTTRGLKRVNMPLLAIDWQPMRSDRVILVMQIMLRPWYRSY